MNTVNQFSSADFFSNEETIKPAAEILAPESADPISIHFNSVVWSTEKDPAKADGKDRLEEFFERVPITFTPKSYRLYQPRNGKNYFEFDVSSTVLSEKLKALLSAELFEQLAKIKTVRVMFNLSDEFYGMKDQQNYVFDLIRSGAKMDVFGKHRRDNNDVKFEVFFGWEGTKESGQYVLSTVMSDHHYN